jgi:hypothetical protein
MAALFIAINMPQNVNICLKSLFLNQLKVKKRAAFLRPLQRLVSLWGKNRNRHRENFTHK